MQITDALMHPTLNGQWIQGSGETFAQAAEQATAANLGHAFACGLPGVGGYAHEAYWAEAEKYEIFTPIAALSETALPVALQDLEMIASIGFKAVKIHERLLGHFFTRKALKALFEKCIELDLIVYYCSYYCTVPQKMPEDDPFWKLRYAMSDLADLRLVIVHGGGVRVLEYAELVRFAPNALLDLSLTMMKYRGSSVDLDLKFLATHFDRKICVGSDHPEYAVMEFRKRTEDLVDGLVAEKQQVSEEVHE